MSEVSHDFEPFLVPLRGAAEQVRALSEPVLLDEGCELVFFQLVRSKQSVRVRFFVDELGGAANLDEKGIGITEIQRVTRRLSAMLDVEAEEAGLFSGKWDLEVSSPGLDRPLAKRSHFPYAVGRHVQVRLVELLDGRRTFKGVLKAVDGDSLHLVHDDDTETVLSLAAVEAANIVYQFPRAGVKGDRTKGAGKKNKNEKNPNQKRANHEPRAANGEMVESS